MTVLLAGCQSAEIPIRQENSDNTRNLVLVANGEDFVHQGFLAKDGWKVEFDRLEVSVSEVIAYNMNSATKSDWENYLKYQPQVLILEQAKTIDLAAGDENARAIMVSNQKVAESIPKSLSWKMQPTENILLPNQTTVLQGKASKSQRNVNFIGGFCVPVQYYCGELINSAQKVYFHQLQMKVSIEPFTWIIYI